MTIPWAKFFQTLEAVGPFVLSVIPGVPASIIPLVVQAIGVAESSQAPGADKKTAVLAELSTGLQILGDVPGAPHVDPAIVTAAVGQGIDAVITTVNAIQVAHAAMAPSVPATA